MLDVLTSFNHINDMGLWEGEIKLTNCTKLCCPLEAAIKSVVQCLPCNFVFIIGVLFALTVRLRRLSELLIVRVNGML